MCIGTYMMHVPPAVSFELEQRDIYISDIQRMLKNMEITFANTILRAPFFLSHLVLHYIFYVFQTNRLAWFNNYSFVINRDDVVKAISESALDRYYDLWMTSFLHHLNCTYFATTFSPNFVYSH